MKRYFCTAAAGLLLALGSTGTASATGLPVVGGTQEATQSVSFGDQTVGEQKNDADVTQEQGSNNLNLALANRHSRRRRDEERPGQRQHRDRGRRPVELGRPVPVGGSASVARSGRLRRLL